jgi:hypothetical protein
MFFLPNNAYYPQLQEIDHVALASNLGMVTMYGFIELLSLLLMGFLIQRKLRISMLHLLSFVLDRLANGSVQLVSLDLLYDPERTGAQRYVHVQIILRELHDYQHFLRSRSGYNF